MNDAIGRNALEYIDSFLSTEEIEESNRRVASIAKTIEAKHNPTIKAEDEE